MTMIVAVALSRLSNLLILLAMGGAAVARADEIASPPIGIQRAAGAITIDGDLSDEGWKGACASTPGTRPTPATTRPPKVRNVGYLTYDDRFFYAGFEFEDPEPSKIRAPLGDRDNVPSYTDYGGVILDTRNDGKTGLLLLANPRGIQYDAVSDDTGGRRGLLARLLLGRHRPHHEGGLDAGDAGARSRRCATPRATRGPGGSCSTATTRATTATSSSTSGCRAAATASSAAARPLTGLAGLPSGGHLVLAPYVTGAADRRGRRTAPARPGSTSQREGDVGLDVKWTPTASTALDATINPDFSQIESDVAQIGVNERFALFFPEKRPFFLEGIELFATPIQAVYTRTITAPRWGVRGTRASSAPPPTRARRRGRRRRQRDPARPQRLRPRRPGLPLVRGGGAAAARPGARPS